MIEAIGGTEQLYLFDTDEGVIRLDSRLWHGSFNARESTLQQLAPYIGKMKSGMAEVLVKLYSKKGDVILDPFCGSGVVPLEAALAGRQVYATDLSPYAYAVTAGKLSTPADEELAVAEANALCDAVDREAATVDISQIPDWVSAFFHSRTLREVVLAFQTLRLEGNYFLMACLLGILHHVRPGFLSYPASHLVPYLRKNKYPQDEFPHMYDYRDLRSRLLAKVVRAYRRSRLPSDWKHLRYQVWQENAMNLPIESETVDAVISSPPYFGALDYARDNRLRLWFLGCENWKELDAALTANRKVYLPQMGKCLQEIYRVLKPGGNCVLVLGDVERDGKLRRTAEILADVAVDSTDHGFAVETIYDDRIPDERRSRRQTKTTKFERILVMVKH